MIFTSSILGEVQHPINILREYMEAFGNKCQAAIVSWLDGWAYTKRSKRQEEWIWLTLSSLSRELGYCRDTIHVHLKKLLNAGIVERRLAKRWPTDRAWAYRLVEHKVIQKILPAVENQTIDSKKPDYGQSENQTMDNPISDYIPNSVLISPPKPNLKEAKIFSQEEEIIDNSKELSIDNSGIVDEVSKESKQEIIQYVGDFSQKDQSSEPDFLGEKIPSNLQQKLEKAGIEVDDRVREAIASHHPSQALAAAQHCIDTADSIKNPKGVFLFQISRQPVEPVGSRLPVKTAADFQVEKSVAPKGFWELGKEILRKANDKERRKRTIGKD